MTELKRCPHHAKLEPHVYKQRHGLWVIFCDEPDCFLTVPHKDKEDAILEWEQMIKESK